MDNVPPPADHKLVSMIRILNIVGARPNFMKIAPLMTAMHAHPQFCPRLIHTGQHYDENLSKVFFDELGIPRPDLNLDVGSGNREQQIEAIATAFRPVLKREAADAVLVVGDVNSTIACATVAREQSVPVVHVEAGLRSFDMSMPEEVNRLETDAISDYLFVTEDSGMRNLANEGVPGEAYLVGNVMIDTLFANLDRARQTKILHQLGVTPGHYMVATFHRPANVDSRQTLTRVVELLEAVCARTELVLPVHPRTRASLNRHGLMSTLEGIHNLHTCEPLGYLDFIGLVVASRAVVTDSGGIQEETTALGVPCLTMRGNTERPVTVDLGSNLLIGDDHQRLLCEVDNILHGRFKRGQIPPLWDGRAAERIVDVLARVLTPAAA